jgi:hypothetical protein
MTRVRYCLLFGQEAVPARSRYQSGADATKIMRSSGARDVPQRASAAAVASSGHRPADHATTQRGRAICAAHRQVT